MTTKLLRCLAVTLLLVAFGPGTARLGWAQTPEAQPQASAPAAQPAEPKEEQEAPDSPRASLRAYLLDARAGDWTKAARYLSLTEDQTARGTQLAERLKAVLDRHLWFDLEEISPDPEGKRDDGLAANLEEVGRIPIGNDRTQPVRMVRTSDADGAYWAFSRSTVGNIDAWYGQLDDRWIRDVLTDAGLDSLLLPGPFEILWWQWIALPLLVIVAWLSGKVLGHVTAAVLGRLFGRTRNEWDDKLLARIEPQLAFAWTLLVFRVVLPSLGLTVPAERLLQAFVSAGAVLVLFWALWRAADVVVEAMMSRPWATSSPSARNLLSIGSSLAKGVIVATGLLAVLSAFGYPITTLLATLGIGGLAFAFGAQKTVENLFGSVALATDQPFRVGDFVKVEDFVGTVEDIGFRSTRFRTLDRTLISIPNGKLADQRLESFAARDRMRLATTIGVEYGTTHAQMQQVLDGFTQVLREHSKIWPDAVVVKFKEFGASSLDIEIMAWFEVPTWGDFQQCRQEVLLGFMKVVEDAGTAFAFPTRTVHLVNPPATADGENRV